jgi:hypothetical protein
MVQKKLDEGIYQAGAKFRSVYNIFGRDNISSLFASNARSILEMYDV